MCVSANITLAAAPREREVDVVVTSYRGVRKWVNFVLHFYFFLHFSRVSLDTTGCSASGLLLCCAA